MSRENKRITECLNYLIDVIDDEELCNELEEIQANYEQFCNENSFSNDKRKCKNFLSAWDCFIEKYDTKDLPNIIKFRELFDILSQIRKLAHKFKNKAYMPTKLTSIYQKSVDDFYEYLHAFKDAINEQTIITDKKNLKAAQEFAEESASSFARTFKLSSVPEKKEIIKQIISLTSSFSDLLSKSHPFLPHLDELDELTALFKEQFKCSEIIESPKNSARKVLPETLTTFPITLEELRKELTKCSLRIAEHASEVSGSLAQKLIDESQMLTILANSEIKMDEFDNDVNEKDTDTFEEEEEKSKDMQKLYLLISQLKTENKRLREESKKGNITLAMTDRIKESSRRKKDKRDDDSMKEELESLRKERDEVAEALERQCNENNKLKVEILEKENQSLQNALDEKNSRGRSSRSYTSSDSERGSYRKPRSSRRH